MHNIIKNVPIALPIPAERTNAVKKQLESTWNLSMQFRDSALVGHFILYWNSKYLLASLTDGGATLYKEGRLYKVIYHKCTREELISSAQQQVALSFRVPHHKYERLYPTVLVTTSTEHIIKKKQMHQYGTTL